MENLHEKFVEYGVNAKEWMRKCALLLPDIARKQIWKARGFSSIHEYAGRLAGMSHYQVNEALRVMRKVSKLPALREVVAEKGINSVKPLLSIANEDNQQELAKMAREVSVRGLETYAREHKKGLHVKSEDLPLSTVNQDAIWMEVELEVGEELRKIKGERSWNELMKELLATRMGEVPEVVKTTKRTIPAKVRRYIVKRSCGICEFPGCKQVAVIFHHADRFAICGEHDVRRIFHLCKGHERLCHIGHVAGESQNISQWYVRTQAVVSVVDAKVRKYYCRT